MTQTRSILTCRDVIRGGNNMTSLASGQMTVADTITLDETARHRRRIRMVSDGGLPILLDLEEATLLRHGDLLPLDDGRYVMVCAKPEAVYEIRGKNPHHLLRLTWHMGNRHLATQVFSDHVRVREDAVIRRMIEELGGQVTLIQAAFDPEGGAYGDRGHTHDHGGGHNHKHSHEREHEHEHSHERERGDGDGDGDGDGEQHGH